jgi:hypothetical protein
LTGVLAVDAGVLAGLVALRTGALAAGAAGADAASARGGVSSLAQALCWNTVRPLTVQRNTLAAAADCARDTSNKVARTRRFKAGMGGWRLAGDWAV